VFVSLDLAGRFFDPFCHGQKGSGWFIEDLVWLHSQHALDGGRGDAMSFGYLA
jgi:hypothetical protein